MAEEAFSDVLSKLEEQKTAIKESIQEAYTESVNSPPGNDEDQFQNVFNTREAKLARSIEKLVLEDYDPLMFDETKNFLEYIGILRQEIIKTEKLIAFQNAKNEKLKTDTEFYKSKISDLKAAMDKFMTKEDTPQEVSRREQLKKARAKFSELKKQTKFVLKELHPKHHAAIGALITKICAQHFADGGTEYFEVDANVNSRVLETLLVSKIIAAHPHEKNLFKLNIL